MGFVVFLVAIILGVVLLPLGLLYGIGDAFFRMKFKTALKRLDRYFYVTALSIDQLANTMCAELFNDALIKDVRTEFKGEGMLKREVSIICHKFGNPDETISSVLGKNKKLGTLTRTGKILDWILDKIDKNHTVKSIEN